VSAARAGINTDKLRRSPAPLELDFFFLGAPSDSAARSRQDGATRTLRCAEPAGWRDIGGERQGVDAAGKFVGNDLIDHSVARYTRLSRKFLRNHQNTEMAFASSWGGPVTCMHFAFIDDVKAYGFQSDHQFFT
jgi:hypothetical protein